MTSPLWIPLGAQTAGQTYTIDGRTYRPLLIDSSGRLIVIGDGAGNTIVVSATDLDIRDLAKAQDELYAVLRTDAGTAYDGRDRNWTITETVPVSQSTPDDLRVGVYGRFGGAWQRQPLQFGFGDQFSFSGVNGAAGAGFNQIGSGGVPANTLRVVTAVTAIDRTTSPTYIALFAAIGGTDHTLKSVAAPAARQSADWQGQAYLESGDSIRADFGGVTLNDVIEMQAVGYDMALNL